MTDVFPSTFELMDTDPSQVKQALNAIYGNTAMASLLQSIGTTSIAIGTDKITGLPAGKATAFVAPGVDVSGMVNEAGLSQDQINRINAGNFVNVGSADTNYLNGNGGTFASNTEGAIFHELFHAAYLIAPGSTPLADIFKEQVAIFATNISYHKSAGLPERIGHINGGWTGTEVTGYVSAGEITSFSWINGRATFTTNDSDGVGNVTKSFGTSSFGGQEVLNYNTIVRDTGGADVAGISDSKMTSIFGQSIGGSASSVASAKSTSLVASNLIYQYLGDSVAVTNSASRFVSVTNDTIIDSFGSYSAFSASGPIVNGTDHFEGFHGSDLIPFYTSDAPSSYYIDDSAATIGAYIIGGAQGVQGDILIGGSGSDIIRVGSGAGPNTIDAGEGNNFIIGGVFDDHIIASSGDDVIFGSYGADIINAGGGSNVLIYQGFSSSIELNLSLAVGGISSNIQGAVISNVGTIIGTQYSDILTGNGSSTLYGGGGSDIFRVSGSDKAVGGSQSDTFIVLGGTPDIVGEGGDTLKFQDGSGHEFSIQGGQLAIDGVAYAGFSTVHAGSGNNTFSSFAPGVTFMGGEGQDTFAPTSLSDWMTFNAGGGLGDRLDLSHVTSKPGVTLDLKLGTLEAYGHTYDVSTFDEFDFTGLGFTIWGTEAPTEIINSFDNPAQWWGEIHGRGGTDFIYAKDYDYVYGDAGNDFIFMGNIGQAYGGDNDDTIFTTGQAFLHGDGGNDTLKGSDLNNALYGDAGDDQLFGFGGQDQLWGGAGNNTLNGGDEWDFGFISGTGRGQPGGVKAIYADNAGAWHVVKDALNPDGSHQTDIIVGVETLIFDTYYSATSSYQDSLNLYAGFSYVEPGFII